MDKMKYFYTIMKKKSLQYLLFVKITKVPIKSQVQNKDIKPSHTKRNWVGRVLNKKTHDTSNEVRT